MTLYLADHSRIGDLYNTEFPVVFTVNSVEDMKEAMNKDMMMSKRTNNSRKSALTAWEASDCLYGDIDGGMSLEQFKERFGAYESYTATSKSHQKGKNGKAPSDCFHVFFPIAPTQDRAEYKKLLGMLVNHEGFDHNAKDLSRMFSGNPESIVAYNKGIPVTNYLYNKFYSHDENGDEIEAHTPTTSSHKPLSEMGEGDGRNSLIKSMIAAKIGEGKSLDAIVKEIIDSSDHMKQPQSDHELKNELISVFKTVAPKEIDRLFNAVRSGKILKTPREIPKIIGVTSEARDYIDGLIFKGTQFLKTEFPPVETYMESLITAGFTIVAGAPKSGKSWLSLEWGMAIADGKPWKEYETRKSKVLIMALEDIPDRLQKRVMTINSQELPDDLHILLDDRILRQDNKLDFLDDMIKRHKYDVVFIDTLSKYMGTPDGGGNGYQNEYALYVKLGDVARDNCMAIISYTHTNQANYGIGDMKKISGSNGLPGASDNYIVIDVNGMNVDGRGLPMEVVPYVFNHDKEKPGWTAVSGLPMKGKSDAEIHKEGCRAAIMQVIERSGKPMKMNEIKEAVAELHPVTFTKELIGKCVYRLKEGNALVNDSWGSGSVWRVPREGEVLWKNPQNAK